jgi:hypothetical protein
MSPESSRSIFVRLPADLRQWVVHEALVGRRSMNALVVEAIELLKANRTDRLAEEKHALAIELAISLVRCPNGTEIILRLGCNNHRTEILVREPSQVDYLVLASVQGEEVVFADDVAGGIRSRNGQ